MCGTPVASAPGARARFRRNHARNRISWLQARGACVPGIDRAMQIPSLLRAGDLVRIRRRRWRIVQVHAHEGCQVLTVTGIDAKAFGANRRYLTPFDTAEPVHRAVRARAVSRSRWRRACRALLAANAPPGALRAGCFAAIDLLPHQLEPALAAVHGLGSRFLLADDVGLGKTIQAGLVLSELRAREAVDRALILTPAGLREQWMDELARRFTLDAAIVDARDVRRRSAALPADVNPWSTVDLAIASVDFVKRPEVLAAVRTCRWDLLIVDEAHGVSNDNDRQAACADLAGRAAYVLLLTGTPHNGDRRAFQSLCGVGTHGDPLLLFRRTRLDVRLGLERRIRRLLVRPSATERQMHALVARLSREVRARWTSRRDPSASPGGSPGDAAPWLALAVLHKRALSSATSLAQTVERRLRALAVDASVTRADDAEQLPLPLADREGEHSEEDRAPDLQALALGDPARERALLERLASAARLAARHETKIDALARLLRRVAEPVVVFTEYRDTLLNVQHALRCPAAVLHGGLDREERAAALEDFVAGRMRLLLATDAAGEGLNLHQACRLVVNLELPWSPTRLEQRIGRVDRIGQRRTVHAIHLIARDTAETRVLDHLRARVASARVDIDAATPLGPLGNTEESIARSVLGSPRQKGALPNLGSSRSDAEGGRALTPIAVSLTAEAGAEASRLAGVRRLVNDAVVVDRPWVAFARNRATRASLGVRMLLMVRLAYEDATGRLVESALVPLAAPFRVGSNRLTRRQMLELVDGLGPEAARLADAVSAPWKQAALAYAKAFAEVRLTRAEAVAEALANGQPASYQPGLFDRRAERRQLAALDLASRAVQHAALRVAEAQRGSHIHLRPPELLLVLAP